MSRGDERAVVEGVRGLADQSGPGCAIRRELVGICADHGDQHMYVEAKGKTSSPGLVVDTAYGQVFRRMPAEDDLSATYALVVRDEPNSVQAAMRVPIRVRRVLRIRVFAVADTGHVRELESDP